MNTSSLVRISFVLGFLGLAGCAGGDREDTTASGSAITDSNDERPPHPVIGEGVFVQVEQGASWTIQLTVDSSEVDKIHGVLFSTHPGESPSDYERRTTRITSDAVWDAATSKYVMDQGPCKVRFAREMSTSFPLPTARVLVSSEGCADRLDTKREIEAILKPTI